MTRCKDNFLLNSTTKKNKIATDEKRQILFIVYSKPQQSRYSQQTHTTKHNYQCMITASIAEIAPETMNKSLHSEKYTYTWKINSLTFKTPPGHC